MTRGSAGFAITASAFALAAGASPAVAADIGVDAAVVTYRAAPGEANQVQLTPVDGTTVRITRGSSAVTAGAGCHDTVLTFQRRGQTITSDVVECSIEPSFVGRATVDVRLGDGDDLGRLGPGHGEQASAWQVFIHGGAGADELYDEPGSLYTGRVRLLGDGGNDLVSLKYSGRSGDYGEGGLGRDTLLGGAGADTLVGGGGRDSFAAGRGADKVAAKDHLRDLRIDCGPGADQLAFDATLDPPAVSC